MQVKTAKIKIKGIIAKLDVSTDKIDLIFSKKPLEKKFLEEKILLFIQEHSIKQVEINIFQVLEKIEKFKTKKVKTKYRGKRKNEKKVVPKKTFKKGYLIEPTEAETTTPATKREIKKQKRKQEKKWRRKKATKAHKEICSSCTTDGRIDFNKIGIVWEELTLILKKKRY